MPKQRIKGLVREAQRYRRAFSASLAPAEQHELHARLLQTLTQIDRELARARLTPARLTGPSRLAYDYLKKLQEIAVPAAAEPSPPALPPAAVVAALEA